MMPFSIGLNASLKPAEKFEKLSREKGVLHRQAESSDRNRAALDASLGSLRLLEKQLQEEVRVCSDTLGKFHRQKNMLMNDKARLLRLINDERKGLELVTRELEEIWTVETSSKVNYCREMQKLNFSLSNLLLKKDEVLHQQYVTVDSVYGCEISPPAVGLARENEFDSAVSFFEASVDYLNDAVIKQDTLESMISSCRSLVLGNADVIHKFTPDQLFELEHLWEQVWELDPLVSSEEREMNSRRGEDGDPVHAQIFYGDS